MSDITQAQQSYEQQRAFGNELIRRQRELLHSFATMLEAGRRDFEQTKKELEDRLNACEAARQKKRQEAEAKYKRAMDVILERVDQLYPAQGESEKARKTLLSEIQSKSSTKLITLKPFHTDAVDFFYFVTYIKSIVSNVQSIKVNSFLGIITPRQRKEAFLKLVVNASILVSLYSVWLKAVDQEAEAQEAEIHKQYQQVLERAKQAAANFQQEMAQQAAKFIVLSNQVTPSWDDPAWQAWQPGMGTPGVVRLGTFIYPPKTK